jgi:hypothetical protein
MVSSAGLKADGALKQITFAPSLPKKVLMKLKKKILVSRYELRE